MKTRITFECDRKLEEHLKKLAKKQDRSVSSIIRHAITKFLDGLKK